VQSTVGAAERLRVNVDLAVSTDTKFRMRIPNLIVRVSLARAYGDHLARSESWMFGVGMRTTGRMESTERRPSFTVETPRSVRL